MRSWPFARRGIGLVVLALGACSKTPTYVPDLTGGAGGASGGTGGASQSASSSQGMSSSGGGMGAGPQCANAGDCGMLTTACSHPTCVAGTCVMQFEPMGTVIAAQISNDCKQNVCDGMGQVIAVADPADLPYNHNLCTTDACMGTTPVHMPEPVGTHCGKGNGHCNGMGVCVGCQDNNECGQNGPCFTWTCSSSNGVCQPVFTPAGTGNPGGGAPGDCQKYACDGMGGVAPVAEPADVPPSPSACLLGACSGSTPTTQPAPASTPCAGGMCDGAGHCGTCQTAGDCAMTSPCVTPVCIAGHCSSTYAPQGPASTQTTGDCRDQVCDGMGGVTTKVNDADVPPDPDACTTASCSGGAVVHKAVTVPSSNNPCIVDGCDPVGGVYHKPLANGAACGGCSKCQGTTCTNPCPPMGLVCLGTVCG